MKGPNDANRRILWARIAKKSRPQPGDLFIFKVRYIYSVKKDAAFWTDFWKGFK